MIDKERDDLVVEMHNDIKLLNQVLGEHKQTHSKYIYYFITTAIASGLSWFR